MNVADEETTSGRAQTGDAAVVSRYDIAAQGQGALARLLEEHLRDWICARPGFVSGSVLRSIDEGHVVVSTTWRHASDGVNFMACNEGRALFAALTDSGARKRESHVYRWGDVVGPKRNG